MVASPGGKVLFAHKKTNISLDYIQICVFLGFWNVCIYLLILFFMRFTVRYDLYRIRGFPTHSPSLQAAWESWYVLCVHNHRREHGFTFARNWQNAFTVFGESAFKKVLRPHLGSSSRLFLKVCRILKTGLGIIWAPNVVVLTLKDNYFAGLSQIRCILHVNFIMSRVAFWGFVLFKPVICIALPSRHWIKFKITTGLSWLDKGYVKVK